MGLPSEVVTESAGKEGRGRGVPLGGGDGECREGGQRSWGALGGGDGECREGGQRSWGALGGGDGECREGGQRSWGALRGGELPESQGQGGITPQSALVLAMCCPTLQSHHVRVCILPLFFFSVARAISISTHTMSAVFVYYLSSFSVLPGISHFHHTMCVFVYYLSSFSVCQVFPFPSHHVRVCILPLFFFSVPGISISITPCACLYITSLLFQRARYFHFHHAMCMFVSSSFFPCCPDITVMVDWA